MYRQSIDSKSMKKSFGVVLVITLFAAQATSQKPFEVVASHAQAPAQTPGEGPMEFMRINLGTFVMGCSQGDEHCAPKEKPAHRVRITKGFEIGKYEVTQAQWKSVMGNNPSYFKGVDLPVEEVSWNDVQQFLQKMNAHQDGYRYRLPTDAEWEYAARAGTMGKYYASSLDAIAWYDANSGKRTHPVGHKQPNAWGLYDMLGNVQEWVQDWYDGPYQSSAEVTDPQGSPHPLVALWGMDRTVRGGSWLTDAGTAKVSIRGHVFVGQRGTAVGFRCVRERVEN